MSKSLLSLFVAVLFVLGFTAGIANAGKGIFEAPQVSNDGVEVSGSEGKIERDGDYKVEIEPVTPSTTFDICLDDTSGTDILRDGTSDADGELKVDSNLNTDRADLFPASTTTTTQSPSLQVRDDTATIDGTCVTFVCTVGKIGAPCPGGMNAECNLAGDCTGTLFWESGMDVVIP